MSAKWALAMMALVTAVVMESPMYAASANVQGTLSTVSSSVSSDSSTATGAVLAATDTTPPTAPKGLTATDASATQINLTWTASTDNVGVKGYRVESCSGASCTTFAQIGTPTATSYSATGLTPSTKYSFRVRATDAAGNLSGYSNTASATTAADTTPPSAPGTPSLTVVSSTQINLTWAASTDNVGVTGYRVERCSGASCTTFTQIGTPTTTSYSATGLTASTKYSFRVRANDAAGNLSSYSSTASATTSAAPDTTPPTAPGTPSLTVVSSTQINLTWAASTDNVGVTGYRVESCSGASCTTFTQIGTPTTTSYSATGLTAATQYSFRVRATDAGGNLSSYSSTASATTSAAPDTTPPTAPGTPSLSVASSTQINLTWTASTDNVGVTGYRVERCSGASCTTFAQIAAPTTTSYSDTGLTGSTSYSYRVRANDAAGNLSSYSSTASATTSAPPDTTPPSAPGTPNLTVVSPTQINLTWVASTDNVGVTGYLIQRCQGTSCTSFVQIGTSTTNSYTDTGLTAGTSYSYRVQATDAAANLSGFSSTATASTSAPPTPPGTPSLSVVSSTQINLSWAASTDNVGVTGYRVERCSGASCTTFAQIGAPTTTSYSDTGLTASTSYSYRIRATDAAGNLSSYSSTASASTSAAPDTTPPTVPGTPTLTVVSAIQINLTWAASTDNVGVAGYLIQRCQGTSCTSFAQIGTSTTNSFTDTSVIAGTSYSYQVQATDAAGNLSGFSSTATATTAGPADNTPPTVPGTPSLILVYPYLVVNWAASTDNVGVTGYTVERCSGANCTTFAQIAAPTTSPYLDSGLAAGTSYSYRVRATDAAGNLSSYSGTATTIWPDITPPTVPGAPSLTVVSSSQINATWAASTDNVGVTGYLIQRCQGTSCTSFAQIGTSTTNSYTDTGLTGSTSYSYQVQATDAAGNLSGFSSTATAITPAYVDTTPPTAPMALNASVISPTQINLTWGASTDNVGVTGYLVERCQGVSCTAFSQIGTPNATSYSDVSLTPLASYSYRVRATDAAGNLSAYSSVANATTSSWTNLYSYDPTTGRLLTVVTATGTVRYFYDAAGHVTRITFGP